MAEPEVGHGNKLADDISRDDYHNTSVMMCFRGWGGGDVSPTSSLHDSRSSTFPLIPPRVSQPAATIQVHIVKVSGSLGMFYHSYLVASVPRG